MITTHTPSFPLSGDNREALQAGLDYVAIGDTSCADPLIAMMDLLGHSSTRKHVKPYKTAAWFARDADYIVPELTQQTRFALNADNFIHQVKIANEGGVQVKPVLLGPITYLWSGEAQDNLNKLDLLDELLPVYAELLQNLADAGVEWVQIDEPVLTQALDDEWIHALQQSYYYLQRSPIKTLLATYSGTIESNLKTLCELNVDGVHLDAVSAKEDIDKVIDWLPHYKVLSLSVLGDSEATTSSVDETLSWLKPIYGALQKRLWLAPSCVLSGHTVEQAEQKLQEINLIAQKLSQATKKNISKAAA